MTEYLITFPDTHSMIKSEVALKEKGIAFRSMPLPATLGDSCGFCLRVWQDSLEKSVTSLKAANIKLSGIYEISNIDGKKKYKSCL